MNTNQHIETWKISEKEFNDSLNILNNWRSSHAYPLQIITDELNFLNQNKVIVQRLKRLHSIIGKMCSSRSCD